MPSSSLGTSISTKLNQAVVAVCVACVLAMLGISFTGFFYMIVTGGALSWTYSLARLFIPWIGLLSITVAFVRGEHIAMTSLLAVLPARLAMILQRVNLILVAVFAVLMVWYGWLYLSNSTDYYMVSDQIQIHARWVVACVPVTGAVLLVHLLCGTDLLRTPDPMEETDQAAHAIDEGGRP